jgi:hypothetical protein
MIKAVPIQAMFVDIGGVLQIECTFTCAKLASFEMELAG